MKFRIVSYTFGLVQGRFNDKGGVGRRLALKGEDVLPWIVEPSFT